MVFYVIPTRGIEGSANALCGWDCGWYKSIFDNGYVFIQGQQNNTVFPPLFPYLWRLTGVGLFKISIINFSAFTVGMYMLFKTFKFDIKLQFLALSSVSLFFCHIPYSEALFFLFISIALVGYRKENFLYLFIGIYFAGLTRSALMLFIPMAICVELVMQEGRRSIKYFAVFLASSLLSLVTYMYILWATTGHAFANFETTEHWGRSFYFPKIPFTTWDSFRLIWLDGTALVFSLVAIVFGISIFILRKKLTFFLKREFLLSVAYIGSISLISLFLTGYDAGGGTTMFNDNRYIFATPFFTIFLYFVHGRIKIDVKFILYFIAAMVAYWSLFLHKDNFMSTVIYYSVPSAWIFAYCVLLDKRTPQPFYLIFYIVSFYIQMMLLSDFMKGFWIG